VIVDAVTDPRQHLVDVAARLISTGEPLTTRAIAAEHGSSTMAIYTHFGGLGGLRDAVRRAAFVRLAGRLSAVTVTGDPVADLSVVGRTYTINAIDNRQLYRLMFDDEPDPTASEPIVEPVTAAVQRCLDAGRFDPADPGQLMTQLWVMTHGIVGLALAAAIDTEATIDHLAAMATNLYVSFGDDPDAAATSLRRARRRRIDAGPLFAELLQPAL
jgi:AcrR family transcriptional regulator